VKSAVVLADQLKADALLVFTIRGNMARHAASCRPRYTPIYAVCEFNGVADSLSLDWGVESFVHPFNHDKPEETVESALKSLVNQERLRRGNTVVIISAITAGEQIVDVVEMRVVG
jgi:pyruvate kinase